MAEFPEINRLNALREKFDVSIRKTGKFLRDRNYYPEVVFRIGSTSYNIYIDDEFNDLRIGNSLLNLCLVLRSLEIYEDTDDYLQWCTELGIDSSDNIARAYHMGLRTMYSEIESRIGKIDSCISDFDFELNAGAAQELRRKNGF